MILTSSSDRRRERAARMEVKISTKDLKRFQSKIDIRSNSECWPWLRYCDIYGYGRFKYKGKMIFSHRFAFAFKNDYLADDLVVRHSCDNPRCCNPNHLLMGTHQDNKNDAVRRDRLAKGESNGSAKLTEKDVLTIRSSSLSLRELARQFNVASKTIFNVRANKNWRHLLSTTPL